jgi:dUTP pyrophosphatase
MMYLGKKEIVQRIEKEKLVECDEKNIEGAGVDLSIDRLFEISSKALLGKEKRILPKLREVDPPFELEPGRYYLCITKEKINMPIDLIAFVLPRSTLFRSGASIRTAVVDPGFKGALTIGIKNEGEHKIEIEKHSRIAQIVFSHVKGAMPYEGKYQGGKIS